MEPSQFQGKLLGTVPLSIRILLADDNPRFLHFVTILLRVNPQIEIIGTASSGRDALAQIDRLQPDLVLMDVAMPDLNGLELTRFLKKRSALPRIIIVTTYDDPEYRLAAEGAQADGFVAKADLSLKLLPAIYALFPKI